MKTKVIDVIFTLPLFYYIIKMIFYSENTNKIDIAILSITFIYIIFRDLKINKKNEK
jgi:hypothetical protein